MAADAFWLMIEGQNFDASIYDTQDLSTIRGGSLLMRDLVTRANQWLTQRLGQQAMAARLGGSVGLWRLTADRATAEQAARGLRAHLDAGVALHLAYGLALVADDGGGYRQQRNRLAAILQRDRLSSAQLPYPDLTRNRAVPGVCPVDLVSPVAEETRQKIGPDTWIETSASVHARRRFGMDQKQTLVEEETGSAGDALIHKAKELAARKGRPFAIQITSISEGAKPPAGLRANLHDKICVIALDGNGFGKLEAQALQGGNDTPDAQRRFDAALAGLRARLVARVFSRLVELGGYGPPSAAEVAVREDLREPIRDNILRFELLLWGGDEIMFIVPARIGWEILEEFASAAANDNVLNSPVTFAVGAVFCHHDAPIARIKRLADDLTGHLKDLKPEGGAGRDGKAETLFLVEVLESFDHIGRDLGTHLDKRVPEPTGDALAPAARKAFAALSLSDLEHLRQAAQALAGGTGGLLSRGRLRATAHALHHGRAAGARFRDDWKAFVTEAADLLHGPAKDAMSAIGRDRFFVLIEDYWDYLVPVQQPDPAPIRVQMPDEAPT